MTATPARMGFIMEPYRRAVATTAQAQTRHGNLARESEDPVETWFDSVTDAEQVAQARQALLSPERRRFRAAVNSTDELAALAYTGGTVPLATYVDTERVADMTAIVSEIIIDLDKDGAVATAWG